MKLRLPDGSEVEGESIPFTIVEENFNTYQLANGATARCKTVTMRIIKTGKKNADGTPMYLFTNQFVTVVEEKDETTPVPSIN
jgi:hypothetical protein